MRVEAEGGLQAEGLRINRLEKPFGIPADTPEFSWNVVSDRKDTKQTAYRVVITKTSAQMQEAQKGKGGFTFDTGWQTSETNIGVRPGVRLEENQLYYWSVQIRDNYGRTSSYSAAQAFSTAVGSKWNNRQGIWFGSSDYVFLRWQQEIKMDQIEKVLFSATAVSPEDTRQYVYNLYVNGQSVGMGPGRILKGVLHYNTYDITEYLKDGQNVVGAICYSESGHAFMGQMTAYYRDGSQKVLTNTGTNRTSWRALSGDSAFGNNSVNVGSGGYYMQAAENMNSKVYPHGWLKAEYSLTGWNTPSAVNGCTSYQLEPYPSDNINRYSVTPASVKQLSGNRYIVDFGREMIGSLSLNVNCNKEQKISVYYGETLNDDGSVRYQMATGNKYAETWTLKPGSQELSGVNMKTFRYVQISNCPVALTTNHIRGLQVRQEFSEDGADFSSANPVLNDAYDLAKYTIQTTNQNMYVDTQSRERQNYSGDLYINMMSSYSMESDYTLSAYSLEYALKNPTWPAEYLLYSVSASWQYYLYSGDSSFLSKHYNELTSHMGQFSVDGTGLVVKPAKTILVDWPSIEQDGYDVDSSYYNTVLNAIYAGTCEDMAAIAEVLGKSGEAGRYRSLANTVRGNMIARLYNAESGRFADGMTASGARVEHYAQQATAFSLAYGIYSDQAMADKLADSIRQDGLNQMSVYATYFMIQGLYRSNQGTLARQIMSDPSIYDGGHTWANMMYRVGATVTTEAWDLSLKGNMSYAHPWGSAPGSWLVRGLFGITPTSGGYRTFDMKLQPGGVKQASVKVPTLQGSIRASYTLNGNGQLTAKVTVPANTRARVLIPSENAGGRLTVDGVAVAAGNVQGKYLSVELGSGEHTVAGGSGSYLDASEMKQNENVVYRTFGKNWGSWETDGNMSGTNDKAQALYRLQMALNTKSGGGIRYSTHVASHGWRGWQSNGAVDPVTDKMIQAVKIELTGAAAQKWDVYYRVYCQTYGWLDWAKNGQAAGTLGFSKRAEAIEVKLVKKGGPAPGETAVPLKQKGELNYSVHCQTYGWMNTVTEGERAGTEGQAKRLESIKIAVNKELVNCSGDIQYQVHVQTHGWTDWVANGAEAGTTGEAKRLEAIRIRLTGELEQKFDVYYRVHAQSYGWLGWAKNGEGSGTAGQAKRLEAIQIVLVKKGGPSPGSTANANVGISNQISYTTHVQTYGWQNRSYDGGTSGTSGQAKRLEGIQIKLEDATVSGGVRYRTHVQTYGWQDWVYDDQVSGTTGKAKRLEAIQIELTGQAAEKYDVYYRVHCQTYGWLGWAKNGELAGSSGQAKRLEAIQITLVPKGTYMDAGGQAFYASGLRDEYFDEDNVQTDRPLENGGSENSPDAAPSETGEDTEDTEDTQGTENTEDTENVEDVRNIPEEDGEKTGDD
ncbi:MAG: family 78 glycoside hydrolase catalytic domain [Hespellia sp.]|nr:family 78 glycoside hydrolase catalytic domain [Hespellia sp.]